MPIYEYRCTNCGHTFEFLKLGSEKEPKRCPECGCKIEKVISGTNWGYKKGKNPNWPLTEPVVDNKPSSKEYD